MDAAATALSAGDSTAGWSTEVMAAAVKQQMLVGSMAREDKVLAVHRTSRLSGARRAVV